MLHLLNIALVFLALQTVISLNYVEESCVNTYTDVLDNNFLLGTWYEVYKFSMRLNLPASVACNPIVITKPTRADVQKFMNAYKADNPFSFDDDPVLVNRANRYSGMLLGKKAAKFHIFSPDSYFYNRTTYEVKIYEKINDNYILFQECLQRGHTKWLLSRKNSSRDEDIADVLKTIESKVRGCETQRFCGERWFPEKTTKKPSGIMVRP